jgi:hypothetical protein
MSRFDKGRMGDNSSKTMLDAVDEQLDMLAELIVHFLNAVDDEHDLYLLVEKLCEYDDIIMDKLSFAIDSRLMDKDIKDTNPIPSGSKYAH